MQRTDLPESQLTLQVRQMTVSFFVSLMSSSGILKFLPGLFRLRCVDG